MAKRKRQRCTVPQNIIEVPVTSHNSEWSCSFAPFYDFSIGFCSDNVVLYDFSIGFCSCSDNVVLYDFSIGFCSCSDNVVLYDFHFITDSLRLSNTNSTKTD